jgi:hypothetical protein
MKSLHFKLLPMPARKTRMYIKKSQITGVFQKTFATFAPNELSIINF